MFPSRISGRRGGAGSGGRGNRLSSSLPSARPNNRSCSLIGSGNAAGNRMRKLESSVNASSKMIPEESFSLASRDISLVFTSLIRLVPGLVDEIKRIEEQGGTSRIKFDSIGNNPAGNVIEVGKKVYRFTWSPDVGELCNIYEELQSGKDGVGLLVEKGCAWRKLNVQRVLDESTMNRVRMRSEEADRKLKSRKVILLEQGNPALKSQAKAMAAVEAKRMGFKQKDFKKRSVEPFTGPSKLFGKCIPSTTAPLPRSPSQLASLANFDARNPQKIQTAIADPVASRYLPKENTAYVEKDYVHKIASGVEQGRYSGNKNLSVCDSQSTLTAILNEKPMRMSPEALEKAAGETIPNSINLESVIEKVVTFHPPDRYVLKSRTNSESLNEQQGQRHPQGFNSRNPSINGVKDQKTPEPTIRKKVLENDSEVHIKHKLVEPKYIDIFSKMKQSENSKGVHISSTDSESESSDSECVGGSSSDSESDATMNSKQASDEEVDIMGSDDDRPKPSMSHELLFFPSSNRSPNRNLVENRNDGNFDLPASEEVEDIDIISCSPGTSNMLIDGSGLLPNNNIFGKQYGMTEEALNYDHCNPDNLRKGIPEQAIDFRRGDELSRKRVKSDGLTYANDSQFLYNLHTQSRDGVDQVGSGCNAIRNKQTWPNRVDPGAPVLNLHSSAQESFHHVVGARTPKREGNNNRVTGGIKEKVQISEQRFGLHENLHLRKDRDGCSDDVSKQERESTGSGVHGRGSATSRKLVANEQPGVMQASGFTEHGEVNRKHRADAVDKDGSKQGSSSSEVRKEKYNPLSDLNDRKKISLAENSINDHKKHDLSADLNDQKKISLAVNMINDQKGSYSSDTESYPFSKYAKKNPDLKGPIMDHNQYRDYAREYHEKHENYTSLNEILESYRNEFNDMGRDLEAAKDRDKKRYFDILDQLTESYRRCGAKHKRLKNIFVVLHEELKQLKQRIKDYAIS